MVITLCRRWIALVGLLLLGTSCLFGQDFNDYHPLRCAGTIPADLLEHTSEKYRKQLAELGPTENPNEQQSRENFLLQSNYSLDGLLHSGKVLFNDPVSTYLNQLKDYLLREQPRLRKEIRIYAVRSTHVNAFATNQGVLLVNMGLLAHLHNEAELAFILCHEIQHYIKRHPIDNYVHAEKVRSGDVLAGSDEDRFLARCQYSRDQELEADTAGLNLYLTSGYSLSAVASVFDVLLYSPYHFENAEWDKSFFETAHLRFPAAYVLDTVQPFQVNEDENDSLSTHPSIGKRRRELAAIVDSMPDVGRVTYRFGEAEFNGIRNLCRFEQIGTFMAQQRYEAAIYSAYLLLRAFPESYYLKKTIAQALYGLTRHRNEDAFYNVHVAFEYVEGPSQQLYYFFERIEDPALNALAISWTWNLLAQRPDDAQLQTLGQALMDDFFSFHKEAADSISNTPAPQGYFDAFANWVPKPEPEIVIDSAAVWEDSMAYVIEEPTYPENYYRYAFVDLLHQATFSDAYVSTQKEDLKNERESMPDEDFFARNERRNRELRKGKRLGIDKIVVVSPLYRVVKEHKAIPVDHLASESGKETYLDYLKELSGKMGLNYTLLDPVAFREGDVANFNDLVAVHEYFGEVGGDHADVPLLNLRQETADDLMDKYDTRYFVWMGAVDITKPFLFLKRRGVVYITYVFDLAENKLLMDEMRYAPGAGNPSRLRANLYNSLKQIKSKPYTAG